MEEGFFLFMLILNYYENFIYRIYDLVFLNLIVLSSRLFFEWESKIGRKERIEENMLFIVVRVLIGLLEERVL